MTCLCFFAASAFVMNAPRADDEDVGVAEGWKAQRHADLSAKKEREKNSSINGWAGTPACSVCSGLNIMLLVLFYTVWIGNTVWISFWNADMCVLLRMYNPQRHTVAFALWYANDSVSEGINEGIAC